MAQIAQTSAFLASFEAEISNLGPQIWHDAKRGLLAGTYPEATHVFDFGTEQFCRIAKPHKEAKPRISLLHKAGRIRDRYDLETPDAIYEIGSNKQLLIEGLNAIERLAPGTHARFSQIKATGKRPVAATRSELYKVPKEEKHSEQLDSGYFVATNNRGDESRGYLRQAVKLAGFEWGKDFVLRTP